MITSDRSARTTATRCPARSPTSSIATCRSKANCARNGCVPRRPSGSTTTRPSSCWACGCSASGPLAQQPFQLLAERRRDVRTIERIGHIGGQEAKLRAAIIGAAIELVTVERCCFGLRDHRVGKLDLATRAALLIFQNAEDLRLQDVASGDDQVRWRGSARRLLHHLGDFERLALLFADPDDAVHVRLVVRYLLDGKKVCVRAKVAGGIDHLGKAAFLALDQHVRQQYGEWLVADDVAR